MKTIFFWLLIAAVAFGVYKCMDDNENNRENIAESSYDDEDSVYREVDDRVNNNVYVAISEEDTFKMIDSASEIAESPVHTQYSDNDDEYEVSSYIETWIYATNEYGGSHIYSWGTLDALELNNNILTMQFLVKEDVFDEFDREKADIIVQSSFTTDRSNEAKIKMFFNNLRKELLEKNAPTVKVLFVSDGVPARKKDFIYSKEALRKAIYTNFESDF